MENDVTERMVYRMFFLDRKFEYDIMWYYLCTKIEKTWKLFHKT